MGAGDLGSDDCSRLPGPFEPLGRAVVPRKRIRNASGSCADPPATCLCVTHKWPRVRGVAYEVVSGDEAKSDLGLPSFTRLAVQRSESHKPHL
jgi:hypothetical protein